MQILTGKVALITKGNPELYEESTKIVDEGLSQVPAKFRRHKVANNQCVLSRLVTATTAVLANCCFIFIFASSL